MRPNTDKGGRRQQSGSSTSLDLPCNEPRNANATSLMESTHEPNPPPIHPLANSHSMNISNVVYTSHPARDVQEGDQITNMAPYGSTGVAHHPHPHQHQGNPYHSHAHMSNYHPTSQGRQQQSQHQRLPLVSVGNYGSYVQHNPYHPGASSPSAMHPQYTQNVSPGDMIGQISYTSMSPMSGEGNLSATGMPNTQDLPARTVSPSGSSQDVPTDPYYVPFVAAGSSSVGQQFYPSATGPGNYGQMQYQSTPYGMQFYPPYGQPPYYNPNPQRPSGWVTPSSQHQGWRYSNGYAYGNITPSYHRPHMPSRTRPPYNQGSGGGASRSASSSSHASPNTLSTPQKSDVSSTIATPEPSRSGSLRNTKPVTQSLQGQGPRSEHVLWCGNVPADATVDELWTFFSRMPADSDVVTQRIESLKESIQSRSVDAVETDTSSIEIPSHGVLSIFIISRSNCAFVNYATPEHLQRALTFFQGQSLRPDDPRCPKLVCRVRKKDDEVQAGVAGQRGRGMHVAWLKEQERKARDERLELEKDEVVGDIDVEDIVAPKAIWSKAADRDFSAIQDESAMPSALTPTPQRTGTTHSTHARPSLDSSSGGSGSVSFASTNSSLFRHPAFRERFFILKSLRIEDLDQSVKTGTWATQAHNEAVLDQAFRNSESVYLIFSANQSGGFYGYARMTSPINSPQIDRNATIRPDSIPEDDEGALRPVFLGSNFEDGMIIAPPGSTLSPLQMTPTPSSEEKEDFFSVHKANAASLDVPQKPIRELMQRSTSEKDLTPSIAREAKAIAAPSSADVLRENTDEGEFSRKVDLSLHISESNHPLVISPVDEATGISPLAQEQDQLETESAPPERETPSRQDISLGSTASEPIKRSPLQIENSADSGSIGPAESASYPADAKTQSQLAIRALIHNLRLDEKESVHRAKQLEVIEAEIKSQGQAGLISEDVEAAVQLAFKPQPLASSPESWGKSFKLEWIKVRPLSFSRVRRLRNPWRDDRQIKVSRDGTELEPNVGRQLLEEWEKLDRSQTVSTEEGSISETVDDEDEEEDS